MKLHSHIMHFQPHTADSLKKFRQQTHPEPGEKRLCYSFVGDPDRSNIRMGLTSKVSFEV